MEKLEEGDEKLTFKFMLLGEPEKGLKKRGVE